MHAVTCSPAKVEAFVRVEQNVVFTCIVLHMQGHAPAASRVLFRRSGSTSIREVMTHLASSGSAQMSSDPSPTPEMSQSIAMSPVQAAELNPQDEAPRWVHLSPDSLTVEVEDSAVLQLFYLGEQLALHVSLLAACLSISSGQH